MQWLDSTWQAYSREVYGEVREMTYSRERYVAYRMIEKWLAQGLDADDIARKWNQGNAGPCITGINSHGVPFDSCAYQKKVLAQLTP